MVLSSQALYLLSLFHDYCDKERQAEFISELVQLPSNMLMTTDPVSKETEPSVLLMTLLMLLEGESLGEEKLPYSSTSLFKDIPLKTEEPLSVFHFKQLIKISEDVNCTQLDSAILKLLQKSLLYVLASTTTLLDACLNKPMENKVSIAAHLVTHSPALRSHFELCCLRTPNMKKKKKLKTLGKPFSTVLTTFADHLVEYLPLVSSYLLRIQGMRKETLGEHLVSSSSRFLGCHAKLPPRALCDIPKKTAAEETSERSAMFLFCTAFDKHKTQKYNFALLFLLAPDLGIFRRLVFFGIVSFFQVFLPPNTHALNRCFWQM